MYKHIIDTNEDFYGVHLFLSESTDRVLFCDTETTSLDPRIGKILTFQIYDGEQIYIYDFTKLGLESLENLVSLIKSTKTKTVWHNAKFDAKFIFHNTGIWLTNMVDTMNTEVLLNAGLGKSLYSLDDLCKKYCGLELNKEVRKGFFNSEISELTDQMLNYSAMDVKVLKDIHTAQMELVKKANEVDVFELEMQLLWVVAKMEYDGVLLDTEKWKSLESKERVRLDSLYQQILEGFIDEIDFSKYSDASEVANALCIPVRTKKMDRELKTFIAPDVIKGWVKNNYNLASPKQLKAGLNLVGINIESVDKKVLRKLKSSKLVDALIEKSECAKRISTYGLGVLDFIHPITGRIHTEFFNMGAATGRFSSGNPMNLQNIPRAEGYHESFIASPGFDFISFDYSQQEFRLAGAISNERLIIDAYLQGADMHTATAALIYKKPLKDVTKDERFVGKTANFTIIYGGTEYALMRNLGISLETSKEIIKAFKDGFKTFSYFKEQAEERIVKLGYSSTPLGRKRYNMPKPVFMDSMEYVKYISKVKREGFNHIIQGGAADITKIAMVNIANKNPFGDKLRILIQVHDELDLECHKSITQDAVKFVENEMLEAERPFLKETPAAVDYKISDCWIH